MDKFEMLEKVVSTTGVSYENAKDALDRSDWDVLEAVILLEKEGRIEKKGAAYNPPAPEKRSKVRGESRKRDGNDMSESGRTLMSFVFRSRLVFTNKTGDDSFGVRLWILFILLVCAFWIVAVVIVVVLIAGYKVTLDCPGLNNARLNQTLSDFCANVTAFFNRFINGNTRPSDPMENPRGNVYHAQEETVEDLYNEADDFVRNVVNNSAEFVDNDADNDDWDEDN